MMSVGRPKKKYTRNQDLRIPVTPLEKALIAEAVKIESRNGELALWVRELCLKMALKYVDEETIDGIPKEWLDELYKLLDAIETDNE